jgi:cell wall-associated NlpC family hydrolase
MLPVIASANNNLAYGAATVDTQILRLRSGPGTSHTVLNRLSEGDIVVILERTNNEWYKVNFHGSVGYVSVPLLRDILTAENFNAVGRITGERVNVRNRPSTTNDILATYSIGTVMTVIGINNGWYKVRHDSHTGYVRSDLMEIIGGHRAAAASARPISFSTEPQADPSLGQQIANFALGYVGTRYVYGGSSPSGFDCSGLVTYVMRNFGISVTRNASGQFRDNGVRIAKSDLAPGDLVFFSSNGGSSVTHVGIYIGDNEFVHASRAGIGVVISRLDSSYYVRVWHGAKRLI